MNDDMTRVIFLDIDGVLNHSNPGEDVYYDVFEGKDLALDQDNINALKKILDNVSDAKIVWSTDWRHYSQSMWNSWKNPCKWLEEQDFLANRIIGKTPQKMSSEHFHDIKWWLDQHDNVKKYAILEDSYFPQDWFGLEKHLVQVNPNKGLTERDADKAIEILNNIVGDERHVRRR